MQHLEASRDESGYHSGCYGRRRLGTGNEGRISEELVSMHLETGILVMYRPGYLESLGLGAGIMWFGDTDSENNNDLISSSTPM